MGGRSGLARARHLYTRARGCSMFVQTRFACLHAHCSQPAKLLTLIPLDGAHPLMQLGAPSAQARHFVSRFALCALQWASKPKRASASTGNTMRISIRFLLALVPARRSERCASRVGACLACLPMAAPSALCAAQPPSAREGARATKPIFARDWAASGRRLARAKANPESAQRRAREIDEARREN